MIKFILFVLACGIALANATIYYVRLDGGTRYSDLNPSGQCNGMADVKFPGGDGTNLNCAFGDIRMLWTKGVWCLGNTPAGCWGWVGKGGDTYIVDQNPNGWRIGWNSGYHSDGGGIDGDPFSSGAPAPPSGTAANPTKILGRNWQNCASDSAKTQVFGGFRVGGVFNLYGASYFNFQCFDITDHFQCGGYAGAYNAQFPGAGCDRGASNPFPDFADTAIGTNNQNTHINFVDLNIHGMAGECWGGALGDDVNITRFRCAGNSVAGMNLDNNDGTTGTGTLTMSNFTIIASGCVEMYPINPAYKYPYLYCTDQDHGGYGDAFGTATATSNPAWIIKMDHGEIAFNTQDGIDGLHVSGHDSNGGVSQLIMTNLLSYSNMGSQVKFGASATLRNSIIYDNPTAMGQAIPGFPPHFNDQLDLFGRGEAGIGVNFGAGRPVVMEGNTIYSSSTSCIVLGFDEGYGDVNENSSGFSFQNNIQVLFVNGASTGWRYSTDKQSDSMFAYPDNVNAVYSWKSTVIAHNSIIGNKYGCPRPYTTETAQNTLCSAPGLVDESYHLWGYGDVSVASPTSPVVGFGAYLSDPANQKDFVDKPRRNPPTIGALEYGSKLPAYPGTGSTVAPTTRPATVAPTVAPTPRPATVAPTTSPATAAPTQSPPTRSPAATGTGLTGDYYAGSNYDKYVASRVDPVVNFTWGAGGPNIVPGFPVDSFSVLWSGHVLSPVSGPVTFYLASDDGSRLFVNGQNIINSYVPQAIKETSGTITLTAGVKYDIQIQYFENGGDADCILSWASPSRVKQVVPQANLFPVC